MLAGCTAPATAPRDIPSAPKATGPKRITAAIMGEPTILSTIYPLAGAVPGLNVVQGWVHAGLAVADDRGVLQPQLGEAVPSLENGLWKLFPDGRMEMTWRIRPNATWHDGHPFTSQDLVFTARAGRDRELPVSPHIAYAFIDAVDAPDPQTVTVRWKQPFIEAPSLFTRLFAPPLPQHILERPFDEDKASFFDLPYWTQEYVGAGSFKLREWVAGSHMVLEAFEGYVLGRPKIDQVEVRFIPDANTLLTNILSGVVELTIGRGLSLDQALQAREQWRDGRVEIATVGWNSLYPQLLTPNPPVIGEAQFRKALMHAMDRQQMADSLLAGLIPVAQSFVGVNDPVHREVEGSIVRYDHDPRRAAQLIEGLGYTKGPDRFYRDGANQRLGVELRARGGSEFNRLVVSTVADHWQRVGVGTEPLLVPPARARDREYEATRPGFTFQELPNYLDYLRRVHGARTPLPENNFSGQNISRYMNPDFDALIDRFFTTVPHPERMATLREIIHHMTDRLNVMPMFYHFVPMMIGNRVQNIVIPTVGEDSAQVWNAHEWDVK